MKSSRWAIILRITLSYFILSVVWITTSDSILFALVHDPEKTRLISIYKGWGFVVVTAGMLAGLLSRELRDLEAAHARIEESEQRFRLLYQDAPISFLSLDAAGNIQIVNQLWCDTLGYAPEQVTGKPFADLMTPPTREHFVQTFGELVSTGGASYQGELELMCADGSLLLAAVTGRTVSLAPLAPGTPREQDASYGGRSGRENTLCDPLSPGLNFCFTLQNVTEQRLLEAESRHQQEEYRRIVDTVPAMIFYLNRRQVVVRVNQAAALQLHKTPAEMIDQPIKTLLPQFASLIDDGFEEILATGNPVLGKTYQTATAEGLPAWVQLDRIPYQGTDGRPEGVVAFVTDITDRVRRERDLEALVDIAAALRQSNNRADIYRTTLQVVLDNLHVEGASLAMRSPNADSLTIESAVGRWEFMAGKAIGIGQGLSHRVVETGQAELTQQVTPADTINGQQYPDDVRAAGAAPLIAEHHTLGAVWVGSRRPIPEEDFRLLRAITDIAAGALQRTLAYEQNQLRLRRVSALHYIDMAISASFDWHVTLNVVLGQAVAMLGMDAAAILTFHPETQSLEYAAGIGFTSGQIEQTSLRMGESQAGQVALKREVRYIPDLHQIDDPMTDRFSRAGENFTTYCAAPLVGKGQVKGVLELFHHSAFNPDSEWMDFLEMLAAQAAIAIDNAQLFEDLQQSNSELRQAYDALILGLSRGLELRDAETQGHANRLVEHTVRLARRLHLPEAQLPHLRRGALLHDIGKMGIPDAVLLKPGPLTAAEWEIMRQHPVYAFDLLSSIEYLKPAMDVPYSHHERWDGSGYPRGLQGEEIPLTARIFAVVDIWDALTHDRPYRAAWDKPRTAAYLREQAGVLLDPRAVNEFLAMLKEDGEIE
ncbi:MAG: HD domain-containing phosphohydrolase [Bellilinea sp.]